MLVFRENKSRGSAESRCAELGAGICALLESGQAARGDDCLALLLLAAELECALADHGHDAARKAALLCDELARALLAAEQPLGARRWVDELRAQRLPAELEFVRAEGYAYYGLEPRAYAALARAVPLRSRAPLVIGVRSIGCSLSAVFCAALARRGALPQRFTVRPEGHAYARRLRFAAKELELLAGRRDSDVFVVDEGPGLSGSTFLAVADELSRAGFAGERIHLCCSHVPDPERLLAPEASRRWSRYRTLVAPPAHVPRGYRDLSAGAWRTLTYRSPRDWPACWQQQERLKFRSLEGDELWKFEGLPPYDRGPRARAEALADAGFAPALRRTRRGYFAFDWYPGGPECRAPGDPAPVERLASYAAFRAKSLALPNADTRALEQVTEQNVAEALNVSLPAGFRLELARPVIADGRMMPHEWLLAPRGELVKADAIDHGDDHLFPGPTDIAWDLAGAVIEWELDAAETAELLAHYRRSSGDDASKRCGAYAVAYCALRVGACSLAMLSASAAERKRLSRARARYRNALARALCAPASAR